MSQVIYFDQAATTVPKPQEVIAAVAAAMSSMGNAGRGCHAASLEAGRTIFMARSMISELFGGDGPEQVAFTANATESLNMAIYGTLQEGGHVITTVMEHNSVLRPLYEMEKRGVELTFLSPRNGKIHPEDFQAAIKKNTKAIICTHASNLTGDMMDLERIGKICREHKLLFLVDASQTAGVFPIDMKRMGIDILCFTGHKSMMGPQGTGGICVKKGVSIRPLLTGGSGIQTFSRSHPSVMPTALEAGTLNSHGIAGLVAAMRYQEKIGRENILKKELKLAAMLKDGLERIPGVKLYGDFSDEMRAPIVTINIRDWDSGEVADELSESYGILTRPGGHCAPLLHEFLGTRKQGAVRFSLSFHNIEEEVEQVISAVREIAGEES